MIRCRLWCIVVGLAVVGCGASAPLPPESDGPVGGDSRTLDVNLLPDAPLWPDFGPEDRTSPFDLDANFGDAALDASFGDAALDASSGDATPDAPLDLTPDLMLADQQLMDLPPPDAAWPQTCKNARLLTLSAGKVTAHGNSAPLKDEFAKLTCGGSTALSGPQEYFYLYLTGGESYKVTVTPGFDAYYYIFSPGAFCLESGIQKDCSSNGSTGDFSGPVKNGAAKSLVFSPPKSGYYYVAVDSAASSLSGAFVLTVELDCTKYSNACNTGVNSGGSCVSKPKSGSCSDENKCTENDTCVTVGGIGVCKGTAKVCAGDTCNTGLCDKSSGLCVNIPKAGSPSCDDGNKCTVSDACQAGVCKGTTKDCSTSTDICNNGICNTSDGSCIKVPKSGTIYCSDGDLCTQNDICQSGVCKGTARVCSSDSCNNGTCDSSTGNCAKVYKAGSCSDGDNCTTSDTCVKDSSGQGVCRGTTKTCSGDACNDARCDSSSGACVKTYRAGLCSDGDNCTINDACAKMSSGEGKCQGTTKVCPADACNTGLCDKTTGSCSKVYKAGVCSDGDNCTINDSCTKLGSGEGKCEGAAKTCNGDACNTASCDASSGDCVLTFKAGFCSDSDNCTTNDTCVKDSSGKGVCKGTAVVCTSDSCNTGYCDASTGSCVLSYKAGNCSDGDNCTTSDTCVKLSNGQGSCRGTTKTCNGDPCNTSHCDASSGDCVLTFKAGSCSDSDNCTTNDTCVKDSSGKGVCKGTAVVCASDSCNTGYCDASTGSCVLSYKAGNCSDGNNCTVSDTCVKLSNGQGSCRGTTKTCNGDLCNTGYCDASTGNCVKRYKAGTCNDGNNCTINDVCLALSSGEGSCRGTTKTCAGDSCNTGYCDASSGNCVKVYRAGSCSDGNNCTVSDACVKLSNGQGSCRGTTKTCNGDQCNTSTCDGSTGNCVKKYKAGTCNDGNNCTILDTCHNISGVGLCRGSTKVCAGDQCNTGYCDSGTGACKKRFKSGSCSDGNSCTSGDYCASSGGLGSCRSGRWPSDSYEPNNSCGQAKDLGQVNEDAGWVNCAASISPTSDYDYFYGRALEKNHFPCWPGSPQRYYFKIKVTVPSGRTYQACVRKSSCSSFSTCRTASGPTTILLQYTVNGTCASDDHTTGYIRVRATDNKPQCQNYTVSFSYN